MGEEEECGEREKGGEIREREREKERQREGGGEGEL